MGLIPIAGVALALATELALGLRGQYVFNPPYLILGLNLAIIGGISFIIAYLSAKGYVLTGSLTLLLITLSFILSGIIGIANGWFANFSSNWAVTTAAIGLLVFSVLQVVASVQASFRSVPIGTEHRKERLTLAFFVVVLLSVLLLMVIMFNVFPPFFISGIGTTFMDQIFYVLIILLFSFSSVLFLRLYLKSTSPVLYWYGLALGLDAISFLGLALQVQFTDIVNWTGQLGTFLATIYFLIALLSSRKGTNEV